MLNAVRRNQLLLAALASGAVCGLVVGAASRVVVRGPQRMSFPPLLRNVARSVLVGEAYDGTVRAMQNQDFTGVVIAYDQAQKLGAGELNAERILLPADRQDPQMLNTLGYSLADQGQTAHDFKEAERLTRHAVQLWDARIAQLATSNSLKEGRAITRDSLAWALFKEGQYDAARIEQERAVADCQSVAKDGPENAVLHFHLGEIYRALHRLNDARGQYQQALRLNPKDEASKQALGSLPITHNP